MPALPAASSQSAPRRTPWPGVRLLAAAWTVVVIGFYYRRVPALLSDGPGPWGLRGALPTLVLLVLGGTAVAVWSAWQRRRRGAWVKLLVWSLSAVTALGAAVALAGVETHVPSAGEAARRTVIALLAAGLVVFDAFVLGHLVLEGLGFRSAVAAERNVFVFAVGFSAISYVSLLTAAAGVYRPHVVAALLWAIGIVGLARVAARARRAGLQWRPADRQSHVNLASSDRLWIGICAAASVVAFVAALAPETEYDALWYHLWLPLLWLQHGAPTDAPNEFIALYPLTWELVFGAGLAAGGQLAAKLLHFICFPLCGLAVWQFARRFLPGAAPWLSVAVFLTVPTVLWEATTAYVDLALAFYVTAGLYALMAYLERGDAPPTGISESMPRNRWLAVAAICLGTATSVKHLGLTVLALLVAGLVVHFAVRRRVRRGLVPAVAILAAAFLMAAPWYLRAWQATGNPFFPELYKVFGAPPSRWDGAAEQGLDRFKARFGLPRTPLNLVALPWNVTMHGALFGGCTGAVLLLALPAVIASRRRPSSGRDVVRWLGLVTFGYVAVWASPVSSQQLRFLLPVMPLLALLCGDGLTSVLRRVTARPLRSVATALLFALLVLNLPPFTPLHEGDREGWTGWMTHVVRKVPVAVVVGREPADLYLRRHVPTYGAWQHARVHLPASATLLEFGGGDNFYATRARVPMDARAAQGAWASGRGAEPAVRATLDALGVSHVMFDRRQLQDLERSGAAIASHGFRARELALEYEDSGALLYRIGGGTTAHAHRPPGAR